MFLALLAKYTIGNILSPNVCLEKEKVRVNIKSGINRERKYWRECALFLYFSNISQLIFFLSTFKMSTKLNISKHHTV